MAGPKLPPILDDYTGPTNSEWSGLWLMLAGYFLELVILISIYLIIKALSHL